MEAQDAPKSRPKPRKIDVQKQNIHTQVNEVSLEIEATKKELEDEYGQVNINLSDGTYTEIVKEDAK